MKRVALSASLALVILLPTPAPAGAEPITSALGIPSTVAPGVGQQCSGTVATRHATFDGVPLDVNLTFPSPDRKGPYPLIVALHGWPLTKEATFAEADPSKLAPKGYGLRSRLGAHRRRSLRGTRHPISRGCSPTRG